MGIDDDNGAGTPAGAGDSVACDDDDDFERYGGPIAPGNIMTLLRACLKPEYAHLIPHDVVDVHRMTREINSWLVVVGDAATDATAAALAAKQ